MGALILTLAGCGHSDGDRLASGAGLGAGAGALVGAATGGGVGTGALVGGALGAAAGGLTNSSGRKPATKSVGQRSGWVLWPIDLRKSFKIPDWGSAPMLGFLSIG